MVMWLPLTDDGFALLVLLVLFAAVLLPEVWSRLLGRPDRFDRERRARVRALLAEIDNHVTPREENDTR